MIPTWLQIVAAAGLTAIIVYGSIFDKPRGWLRSKIKLLDDLLGCSLCVGFWSGTTVSLIVNTHHAAWQLHAVIALASAAASWLYDSIVGAFQAVEVNLEHLKHLEPFEEEEEESEVSIIGEMKDFYD